MNLIYTPEGKKHLLECLIDPRERVYTLVTDCSIGDPYVRDVYTTDLTREMHSRGHASYITRNRIKLSVYIPMVMELLAYIDFEEISHDSLDRSR